MVGLGLLVFAAGLRAGGALAVVPVIVIGFRWVENPRTLVRIGIAMAAAAAVIGLAFGIDRVIVDVPNDRIATRLAMNDIAGSLAHSAPLAPDEIRDALAGVELVPSASADPQARARALGDNHLLFDDPERGLFAGGVGQTQRDAIRAAHWPIIRVTPGGYLAYRWHYFKRVIGLANEKYPAFYTVFVVSHDQATAIAHQARHSLLQSTLLRIIRPLSRTFLFRPYFYLFVALVMLPFALKRRQVLAITLLASGILYELSLLFTAIRAEYRDSHWLAVSTVLAVILLTVQGTRPRSDENVAVQLA
jgi:hypothetical protein